MKKSQAKYEIDPHNRLVIRKTGRLTQLADFRQVIDGRFAIGEDNSLLYHVKAPASCGRDIPHQVKLRGIWSLTDNYDLKLTLDKWGRRTFGDELTLQGEIISVEKSALLFAVTTKSKDDTQSIYTLKLEGAWQADKQNRLTFRARKEVGLHDILTFDGMWEIGRNYQIIYRYKKARLTRKEEKVHTLIFKGQWDVTDKARVSYLIEGDTESAFNFDASLGIFKGREIKYEIGIGASYIPKGARRIIRLFGTWKIKRDVGLIFEVRYEDKKVQEIIFGAEARMTDNDTILLRLTGGRDNKDIGAELELSRKILKGDGTAFLRLLADKNEASIMAGAAWRW